MDEKLIKKPNPKLEIPSAHTGLLRKQIIIQKLLKEERGIYRTTFKPQKPSPLLAQVKSFLPKLKVANEELSKSKNIQEQGTVPANTETYIEMNLAMYEEESSDSDQSIDSEMEDQHFSTTGAIAQNTSKKLIEDITLIE